jgi:hypothetical protein
VHAHHFTPLKPEIDNVCDGVAVSKVEGVCKHHCLKFGVHKCDIAFILSKSVLRAFTKREQKCGQSFGETQRLIAYGKRKRMNGKGGKRTLP